MIDAGEQGPGNQHPHAGDQRACRRCARRDDLAAAVLKARGSLTDSVPVTAELSTSATPPKSSDVRTAA